MESRIRLLEAGMQPGNLVMNHDEISFHQNDLVIHESCSIFYLNAI